MRYSFRTNLDGLETYLGKCDDIDECPPVGALIVFDFEHDDGAWGHKKQFELEVVSIRYRKYGSLYRQDKTSAEWECNIELHIPRHLKMSIADWQEYRKRHGF